MISIVTTFMYYLFLFPHNSYEMGTIIFPHFIDEENGRPGIGEHSCLMQQSMLLMVSFLLLPTIMTLFVPSMIQNIYVLFRHTYCWCCDQFIFADTHQRPSMLLYLLPRKRGEFEPFEIVPPSPTKSIPRGYKSRCLHNPEQTD